MQAVANTFCENMNAETITIKAGGQTPGRGTELCGCRKIKRMKRESVSGKCQIQTLFFEKFSCIPTPYSFSQNLKVVFEKIGKREKIKRTY